MVIGISNLGGVCSSFIYINPPCFHIGHGTNMGFLSLSYVSPVFRTATLRSTASIRSSGAAALPRVKMELFGRTVFQSGVRIMDQTMENRTSSSSNHDSGPGSPCM
ncbi:hypothetical protein C8R48DRAFT_707325 [Suillus tomentosus]|nr:hypothetical protein C8R48DRAFT_707325 [Suillus tomentosus]